jgi:hypothetical protein
VIPAGHKILETVTILGGFLPPYIWGYTKRSASKGLELRAKPTNWND